MRHSKYFICLLMITGLCRQADGQSTFGGITGAVTDSSGSVVPNAVVSVMNQATGIVRTAVTDSQGNFEATHLNPGMYTVKAEAPGFKTFEHRDVAAADFGWTFAQ